MTEVVDDIVTGSNAGEALKRLEVLAKEAGATLFERVRLLSELLENHQWIEAKFHGEEGKAGDFLGSIYFADIGGLISVWKLRDLYKWRADEVFWQEHKYNLKLLHKEYEDSRNGDMDKRKRANPPIAHAVYEKVVDELNRAKEIVEYKQRTIVDKDAVIADQSKRIEELKQENTALKNRVAVLEAQLDYAERHRVAG